MSSRTYDVLWREAAEKLTDQLEYEIPNEASLIPKDNESRLSHFQTLYVKYIQIYRNLEESYDQMVHPQKRRLLRNVLIGVIGRMLEIKFEMANLESSEFQALDDVMIDLKLTPKDLDITVPRFISEESSKRIDEREKILARSYRNLQQEEDISLAEAILCIQKNERGRQGCLRAKFIKEIRIQADRERILDSNDNEIDVSEAALSIQRVFRGYQARKTGRVEQNQELLFLGMAQSEASARNGAVAKQIANLARRRTVRQQYEEEYQAALIAIKEKIMKNEGPDIREGIQDSFRHWYMETKKETGKLPDFPEEEEWQKTDFRFGAAKKLQTADGEAEGEKGGSGKGSGKNKSTPASAASGGKQKGGKKGEVAEDESEEAALKTTVFMQDIKKENEDYIAKWLNNPADQDNFAQKHDPEIIKGEKRLEVESEIKLQIFHILEEELQNLKMTLEKDKGKKKKGKKDKKGKGKKGKKDKDLTANRTMESLIEELATSGILQKYTKANMSDFLVEHNNMGPIIYEATGKLVIDHSLMDVKRVLTEYCILPLGVQFPHEEFPYVKSVLLVGSKGCGKTMLVNSIATELGAPIFNITPKNTANSPFQGKANVVKMMHMVFKVARAMKPAIIYIDDAEMVFAKKVPKDDTSDPKRIKKDLAKYLKGLKPEDKVMVIGTTSRPWDADKSMVTTFEKVIYIPKPNYAARISIFKESIRSKGIKVIPNTLNLSLLTRLTQNYSAAEILEMVNSVLTTRRVRLMRLKALTDEEFINYLSQKMSETHDDEKAFKEWNEKLPNVKKRQQFLGLNTEEEQPTKKEGKKK